jgi:hypothetical protein
MFKTEEFSATGFEMKNPPCDGQADFFAQL